MRHERQLCVENEAQELGFLNDFYGIPNEGQLWFCMHSAQRARDGIKAADGIKADPEKLSWALNKPSPRLLFCAKCAQ